MDFLTWINAPNGDLLLGLGAQHGARYSPRSTWATQLVALLLSSSGLIRFNSIRDAV